MAKFRPLAFTADLRRVRLSTLPIWLLAAMLSGCAVAPTDFQPEIEPPKQFSATGQTARLDQWWRHFDDPALQRLIDHALADNFTLKAAAERVRQAWAAAGIAGSELIPALNASSGIQHDNDLEGFNTETFTLGLAASYEVDLWGRIRANTQAAERDAMASQADWQAAALSLSGQIASAWYQWVEQRLQLALLEQQIDTNEKFVRILKVRFQGGQATAADLFQQQQVLEGTIADRHRTLANLNVLEHQLAVLSGLPPGELPLPDQVTFPKVPALPETGLTSDLITRRPDLQRQLQRLKAADLRIASAVADRFPRLGLNASLNTTAPDLRDFFNNWLATLAANLVLPVIDGGRRIAEVQRREAQMHEAWHDYSQQVLSALQEVENALSQEQQQVLRWHSIERQVKFLSDANKQIFLRYIYGAIDFLRLLTSITSLQSTERALISAERERIQFRIDLYRALAGGPQMAGNALAGE
ncbi:MAG: TolC family protein [Methylococcales bacterium]|nr:TolC family protein [Methylococcales bacterium]